MTKTVAVAVGVAVATLPPLALLANTEMTVTRDTSVTNKRPAPSRRSIRSPVPRIHGRKEIGFAGSASSVVSMPEGAMLSVLTWAGRDEPNSAWYISAMS